MATSRRTISALTPLLAAIVLAAASLPAGAQERVVRLGHNRAWINPALILGISEGHFQRAGVTVTERVFNNPADIVQAIATGDLDGGVCTSGVLFTARQRNVNVKGVAVVQGGYTPPVTFMVRTDSGINGAADLRGKTVAIAGFGGTTDLFLRYWLSRAGIDPKNDLKLTFVPFHLTMPSLINRQVAAAPFDATLNVQVRQQHPGQVKKLFDYEDITKQAIGNNHVNGLLLVLGDAFVEKNRETAVRFMEGYLRSIRALHENPKKALGELAVASKNDVLRSLEAPPTVPSDGKIYMDALQFDADNALKFGYLKEAIDIKTAVDHTLLDDAAKRVR